MLRRVATPERTVELDHGRGRVGRRGCDRSRPRRRARPTRRAVAPTRPTPRSSRSQLALLPAIGLHLALGLPRGALVHRAAARASRSSATPPRSALGAGLYAGSTRSRRSHRSRSPAASPRSSAWWATSADAAARAPEQERARLQWVAWGSWSPRPSAAGAVVLNALGVVAARHRGQSRPGSTLLVPFSLAVGASDQLAVRIDRLLVHSITLSRPRRAGRRCRTS